MNKSKVALGPGAASIILIIVSLALCMLSMLTLISARNDASLSDRSAMMIEKVYELSGQSERSYAAVDAVLAACRKEADTQEAYLEAIEARLPEGMEMEGDIISWTEPLDNRSLNCAIQVLPLEDSTRAKWFAHKLIVEEPEDDWEWD